MKHNQIYLADIFDFLEKLESASVDLVIADPPYNMHKAEWDTFKTEQDYLDFMYCPITNAILCKVSENN